MNGAAHPAAATARPPAATLIDEVAAFAAGLACDRLPPEVVRKAKLCVLDTLSACLTIGTTAGSTAALAVLGPDGRQGRSRVFGRPETADAGAAAFVNAAAAAATIRTDTHAASASHPGMVVVPAVLALAEEARADGRSVLAGVVAGYEFMIRLGLAVITSELAAVFRPTGLIGPAAAALGAARALGLDPNRTGRAVAIAGHTAAGFNEWVHAGTNEHIYHGGFAAQNAVAAIRLARAGAEAASSLLEGRSGLLAGFSAGGRADRVTAGLGRVFLMADVVHKPTPACIFVQAPVQAAVELISERPIDPDEVESVEVRTTAKAIAFPGCDQPGPFPDATSAQQSIQFGVAAVLVGRGIREESWRNPADPAVARLAARCRLAVHEASGESPRQPVHLAVRLRDGSSREAAILEFRSMSEAELVDRFLLTAGPVLGAARADRALHEIMRLDEVADVNEVTSHLAPA